MNFIKNILDSFPFFNVSTVSDAKTETVSFIDGLIAIGIGLVAWIVSTVGRMGYIGIILLMGLESSFVPFPSEVIMAPAGYHVSQGSMNLILVILCGILGSIMGSLVNYWIAARFGRTFLLKYSRFFFINEERFDKFEKFFNTHGEITTFVGRLIPVVRQYISFPAGLVRMNMGRFIFYTGLGAGIWVTILVAVGYIVGNNIDLVKENIHRISYVLFPALILLVVIYIIVFKRKKAKKKPPVNDE